MQEISDWFGTLPAQLMETSWLEWLGVGFGVVQVLLAKSNKVLLYPFGIASVLITIYILYGVGLYAEVLLNFYYLVMSVYGWLYWTAGSRADPSGRNPVVVSYSGRREWLIVLGIVGLGFPVLYGALVMYTDSTVPVWDSLVSATAWAGTWLLARRKIENWILLNVSNVIAIPLLAYKGLLLYSLLTLFLFIIAVLGYFRWKKMIKNGAV